MPTVTEKISLAREKRDKAEEAFRQALRDGHDHGLSWAKVAEVAGMSEFNVRYLALNLIEQRRQARKGEQAA